MHRVPEPVAAIRGWQRHCVRCEQVGDLVSPVAELKEGVERLRAIREREQEIDWWSNSLPGLKKKHWGETPQIVVDPLPCCCQAEGVDLGYEEEWKRVPAWRCRQRPSLLASPSQVPVHNRFEALELERPVGEDVFKSPPRRLPRARKSTPCLKTAFTKKERRVIVVGDSLFRGPEGPVCRPDPTCREVCCLPEAQVKDIAQNLPSLVCPSDYCPLLIVQSGSDEIFERSLKAIKRDFRGQGWLVDGAGVQVVVSSVPSVAGNGTERTRKAHLINTWLRDCCHHRNFGFFDHGALYLAPGLIAADASPLSPSGKWILAQELAGLIERVLN
ncbi:uncharacterized protein [Anser cygnoides]|uniref:uncharacterized protein isoform X1 n=1 Tax=Anser cygnoides TaxID=8845 RepID=UPI0034D32D22